MDGLRWLLLLFGLLVIAGVYLYSWRGKAPAGKDDADTGRPEPSLDPGNAADAPAIISSTISADSDAESATKNCDGANCCSGRKIFLGWRVDPLHARNRAAPWKIRYFSSL